jgi:MFS family permease
MIGAIYAASTGGMFLIGYALALGATDAQIGLMSTLPMLCIGVQLFAAAIVESGFSRRRLTFLSAFFNTLCWLAIILIPYAAAGASSSIKVWLLMAVISLATLFAYISWNARGSWVGDLIPKEYRGSFFGRLMMYSGIVATVFAIFEGMFLDVVKRHGLGAFSTLFGFGMIFGLVSAAMFLPQPDMPTARHEAQPGLLRLAGQALTNRALMLVALFAIVWSLQSVAGPFYATYMLRYLHMPFFGVGMVNAFTTISFLATGPFWGRVVDRWGCRPVLTVAAAILGPLQLVWLGIDTPRRAYIILPMANLIAGFTISGFNVAMSTLIYKVTPSAGRSVQMAVYSILVTMVVAPLPALGGHLPDWLHSLGGVLHLAVDRDLRYTFYTAGLFIVISSLVARKIHEPGSHPARQMVLSLGNQY